MATFPDLVILVPGITGSVLANAQGEEVWGPSLGAVWRAITSLGESIAGLQLASADVDDGVTATRLMPAAVVPGLIKIDGYSRVTDYLIRYLGVTERQNFFTFPYDWRRDNRVIARRLASSAMEWLTRWRASSGNVDAKLVLIGHSMGGLIARYFIECLGGWPNTRTLITLGTPHRGSLNAVGFLESGMKKNIGPLGLDLSPILRSLPSLYQLLPIYPCVSVRGAPLLRVAEAAESGALPHVDVLMAKAARSFHQEIQDAQAANATVEGYAQAGPALVPVVGIEQPTAQSVQVDGDKVTLLSTYDGEDMGGDGTVPRVSSTPIELSEAGLEVYTAETHAALQNADSTLAHLKGVLTRERIPFRRFQRREDAASLRLDLDDVVLPGEKFRVRVRPSQGDLTVRVTLTPLAGAGPVEAPLLWEEGSRWHSSEFTLAPGVWRVTALADGANSVTDLVVVAEA